MWNKLRKRVYRWAKSYGVSREYRITGFDEYMKPISFTQEMVTYPKWAEWVMWYARPRIRMIKSIEIVARAG